MKVNLKKWTANLVLTSLIAVLLISLAACGTTGATQTTSTTKASVTSSAATTASGATTQPATSPTQPFTLAELAWPAKICLKQLKQLRTALKYFPRR